MAKHNCDSPSANHPFIRNAQNTKSFCIDCGLQAPQPGNDGYAIDSEVWEFLGSLNFSARVTVPGGIDYIDTQLSGRRIA